MQKKSQEHKKINPPPQKKVITHCLVKKDWTWTSVKSHMLYFNVNKEAYLGLVFNQNT